MILLYAAAQGGSEAVIKQPDATGSTPSQLAIDKGHRYLGVHLASYRRCALDPALNPR